jgi:hypothetical protein
MMTQGVFCGCILVSLSNDSGSVVSSNHVYCKICFNKASLTGYKDTMGTSNIVQQLVDCHGIPYFQLYANHHLAYVTYSLDRLLRRQTFSDAAPRLRRTKVGAAATGKKLYGAEPPRAGYGVGH